MEVNFSMITVVCLLHFSKLSLIFKFKAAEICFRGRSEPHRYDVGCTWSHAVFYEKQTPSNCLGMCEFFCLLISTSPFTSPLKSFVYGNETPHSCEQPMGIQLYTHAWALSERDGLTDGVSCIRYKDYPKPHKCILRPLALWVHLIKLDGVFMRHGNIRATYRFNLSLWVLYPPADWESLEKKHNMAFYACLNIVWYRDNLAYMVI